MKDKFTTTDKQLILDYVNEDIRSLTSLFYDRGAEANSNNKDLADSIKHRKELREKIINW